MESAVELLVLGLGLAAAWLSVKPSPELHWERLWKTLLATCIRGQVEAEGGDADAWWARLSAVPFHPAGRDAYEKLFRPSLDRVPVPALPGEHALVERLCALPDPGSRYEFMFRQSEAAQDALMADPEGLGPAFRPSVAVPPAACWQDIAEWNADLQRAIARRLNEVVVMVAGTPSASMKQVVPHGHCVELEAIEEAEFRRHLEHDHQRVMVVAGGDSVWPILQLLHRLPALRDRVLAVISLGSPILGEDSRAWMAEHFQHQAFDTELNRRTLYMAVTDSGDSLRDASEQRFPSPEVPPSGWSPIESVDLGPLPLEAQDPVVLARALWVLLCYCVSTR